MSDSPAVSVLMPAYNAERYLEEAVESILAQTYKDFEFLIIDDGSTDGTRGILERFAARDPRVRYRSRPNTGLVVALNEMIAMARAPLLARMDADDVALPDRFERQVHYLKAHPEVLVVGGMIDLIDYKGRVIASGGNPLTDDAELQQSALEGKTPLSHPTVMMRREVVLAVGGYRQEMDLAEDLDLWLRLGERGQLANLPRVVLKYRLHAQSVCWSRQSQQIDRCRAAIEDACERRGVAVPDVPPPPCRPVDREAKGRYYLWCGWGGFNRGDRLMAIEYGLRALGIKPFGKAPWRLLVCALIKKLKSTPPTRAPEPVGESL
jgi:glycosyltransferase involved in cell wall biosynthesis